MLIRGGDGAALLIRGGRAPGVETPAHEEGREAGVGRKAGWSGAVRKAGWSGAEEGGRKDGRGSSAGRECFLHGLTPETQWRKGGA